MTEPARLHPDDLERLAALVAQRLAPLLADHDAAGRKATPELLTASQVAAMLGTTRDVVYRRRAELGARMIGDGPRPRLRFDAETVLAALPSCSTGRTSQTPDARSRRRSRPRLAAVGGDAYPLLPIRGAEA